MSGARPGRLAPLFAALAVSCAGAAAAGPPVEARPGETFGIPLGGEVAIAGTKVLVEFVSVLEDSRCPKGEQCIAAGNARVALRVRAGSDPPIDVELATTRGPAEADAAGVTVRLVDLEPHPAAGRAQDRRAYRVKISVTAL